MEACASLKDKQCRTEMKRIDTGWFYLLKIVAMVTMTITHTAEVLYATKPECFELDTVLTCLLLGRFAFPIFAFLLIESFYFTKNRKKHLLSMGIIALITEPLFDMGFRNQHPLIFTEQALNSQNVIIPMLLAFLALSITDYLYNREENKASPKTKLLCGLLSIAILASAAVVSTLLKCDYLWHGVLLIYGFAYARKSSRPLFWQAVSLLLFMVININLTGYIYLSIPFTIIFLAAAQNDIKMPDWFKRFAQSKPLKFICRCFYPLHFLGLLIVRIVML